MFCPGSTPNSNTASQDGLTCPVYYASVDPPPLADCGHGCNTVGDPINPTNGNNADHETDIAATGALSPIAFVRFYNSLDSGSTALGVGWRHSYDRQIVAKTQPATFRTFFYNNQRNSPLYASASDACISGSYYIKSQVPAWHNALASFSNGVCTLTQGSVAVATMPIFYGLAQLPPSTGSTIGYDAVRDDGQTVSFLLQGTSIVAPPGTTLRLQQTSGGFQLIADNNDVENYDENGKLLSVTARANVVETMSYDDAGRLNSVTDSFGHSLSVTYDSQGRASAVTRQ